jgi:hypothetical protein
MDSNRVQQDSKSNYNKKHLLVKLPANVKNTKKAMELVGGKEVITSKVIHHIK